MNLVVKLRAFDRKSRQLIVDYPHAQRSCFVSELI
jgi:hypothetical protein